MFGLHFAEPFAEHTQPPVVGTHGAGLEFRLNAACRPVWTPVLRSDVVVGLLNFASHGVSDALFPPAWFLFSWHASILGMAAP